MIECNERHEAVLQSNFETSDADDVILPRAHGHDFIVQIPQHTWEISCVDIFVGICFVTLRTIHIKLQWRTNWNRCWRRGCNYLWNPYYDHLSPCWLRGWCRRWYRCGFGRGCPCGRSCGNRRRRPM